MKLFFIGSLPDAGSETITEPDAKASLRALGSVAAKSGSRLVACSPYEGSVDLEVLRGAAAGGLKKVEIHHPADRDTHDRMVGVLAELGLEAVEFTHSPPERHDEKGLSYAWLLAQLAALEATDLVVAAGGRPGRSASMLLHQAEATKRPILPLGHFGGAAALSLERQRYRLTDRLGPTFAWLHNPSPPELLLEVAEQLVGAARPRHERAQHHPPRVFLSHARSRPSEADLVEMVLRRRDVEVFRDEHAFAAGATVVGEIEEHLARSDVFIALWCREYACSPWCYDELALALERRAAGSIQVWLLRIDETRVVPPAARPIIAYDCFDRDKLASTVIELNDRLQVR